MVITFNTQNVNEVVEVGEVIRNLLTVEQNEAQEVVSPTETTSEAPKKKKTTQSKADVKKEAVEPENDSKTEVTLAELKETAKDAVGRTSRVAVKEVIADYGEKLTDVKAADYAELAGKLTAL